MDRWLQTGTCKKQRTMISEATEQPMPGPSNAVSYEIEKPDSPESNITKERHSALNKSRAMQKTRRYDENYIAFGFMEADNNCPQCVLCNKVLPNSSMFPAKLLRHFQSLHAEYKNKNASFFSRKREQLSKSKMFMHHASHTDNENATEASYIVSYKIAMAGEAYTIAENLIKPCAVEMVKCMLDEKASNTLLKIPVSNDTVARRIKDLSGSIKTELSFRLKSCDFALQMDESTDVAGLAVLLVFVRYQFEHSIQEDLLICKALESNTTGAEIFNLVNKYFIENDLSWDNCIDVCTDGAKAMVGKTAGAVSRIKAIAKNCSSSHCIIHRQALAVKNMPLHLKTVLDESVNIINFIKSRPLNMRLFKILCDDMGSSHTSLLLHTEVRWLSRGKILLRLFELRAEVHAFLLEHPFHLQNQLTNKNWLFRLAYLTDIFSKLNEVNLSLQGKQITVFTANDKIKSFKRKMEFWLSRVEIGEFECFPTLEEICEDTSTKELPQEMVNDIVNHLRNMCASVAQYFPNEWNSNLEKNSWVKNPFVINEKPRSLSSQEYEILIELVSDSSLKLTFEKQPVAEFWCSLKQEYPQLSKKAISILLPFVSTYLCETGFSSYVSTKTKYRNRLDAEPDMRLQLSSIKPDIKKICANKAQYHASH